MFGFHLLFVVNQGVDARPLLCIYCSYVHRFLLQYYVNSLLFPPMQLIGLLNIYLQHYCNILCMEIFLLIKFIWDINGFTCGNGQICCFSHNQCFMWRYKIYFSHEKKFAIWNPKSFTFTISSSYPPLI